MSNYMVTDRAAARYVIQGQQQNQARTQQYWYNAAAARRILWRLPLFRQTHSQGVPMAMKIPRRKLGQNGLEVSAIGLGCMGMSDFYGPSDEETNLKVLNAAIDIGIDFLDTADIYGMGANERLLGKILGARRSEVVLATKFGSVRGPDGAFLGVSGTPEYVRTSCDASLERLNVDHIDLYYQHRVDPTVAIEETVGAMADLVKAGKDVIVLRTFSKVYGMAGLRCGFVIARPDLLEKVIARGGQNFMPTTAVAAAIASLKDSALVAERRRINAGIRQQTFQWLDRNGYSYIPSESNCFLLDTKRPGKEVRDAMAKENVLIGRVWPVMPTYVRITVGTQEEMERFQSAFQKVMKS